MSPTFLRSADGTTTCGRRWSDDADDVDRRTLDHVLAPVLDVGCGPGRHVRALTERGHLALGIDVTPAAVRVARRRGVDVLERSVFDRVPAAGRWRSALLLDGNIGIGGDPARLLARVRELLTPNGRVVVELAAKGTGSHRVHPHHVRLDCDGSSGPWFDWVTVTADALPRSARRAGLLVVEQWWDADRSFATLERAT